MTQKELAEKAGIGVNSVSRYETDERTPTLDVLQKIANVLEIEIEKLLQAGSVLDDSPC